MTVHSKSQHPDMPASPMMDEAAMTLQQLQLSAKEVVGYAARLDRLERQMVERATKAGDRLVAITRRADAVVDALAFREQLLAGLCESIGLLMAQPVQGEALIEGPPADPLIEAAAQIGGISLQLLALAEQVEQAMAENGTPARELTGRELTGRLAPLSVSVCRLRSGVESLDAALQRSAVA